MDVIRLIAIYLIVVNIIGLALMGIDKEMARRQNWRISGKTLFLTAFIGGSVGALIGMYLFHHKTRHRSFAIGMPLILTLQIIIVLLLYFSPIHFEML